MKRVLLKLVILSLVAVITPVAVFCEELESVTVAGFINAGDEKDNNINQMVTRSMISFLSKISTNVTPYTQVESWSEANGFWKNKKLRTASVVSMAREMGSRISVSGVYIVGENDMMAIRVLVHDTATGALKFDRSYKGDAGIDIFDTIDNIIRDVTGQLIGKPVEIGRLKISVQFPERQFRLYINDLFAKDLTSAEPYMDNFVADQIVKVSIRDTNEAEMFSKDVFVEKNFTTEVAYVPTGTLRLRVVDGEALILLSGKMMGKTSTNGELTIPEVTAEQLQELVVKVKNDETARYAFTIKESEIRTLLINGSNVTETSEIPAIIGKNNAIVEETDEAGEEEEQAPAPQTENVNQRMIYFPLVGGMLGYLTGTYAMAGIDLYLVGGWRIFALGGAVIYNSPTLGFGAIPMADAGMGLALKFGIFGIGLKASALMVFGDQISIEPEAGLEIDIWQIFLAGGVRYTFTPGAEGLHPDFRIGIRF